ncbi:hypothetical protein SAMN05444274_10157 [Mariniphaga anaerophila]|uniref:Uncharacterized protein n=1 Tax=Mariniphaga anaerophila TaxID=1484053 RepID=A0A1M4SKQ9_9BACT|nr:hypothetical protein SAMN05444274_10157 [Mariniphaga anaerophila]
MLGYFDKIFASFSSLEKEESIRLKDKAITLRSKSSSQFGVIYGVLKIMPKL